MMKKIADMEACPIGTCGKPCPYVCDSCVFYISMMDGCFSDDWETFNEVAIVKMGKPKPEPEEGHYLIRLVCMNCWEYWWESIPKGKLYFSRTGFTRPSGYGHDAHDAHENEINCPNCECNTVGNVKREEI